MVPEQTKDYEFEERAAIREYDGNLPRGTAEFFARQEIEVRKAQDNIRERKGNAGPKESKIAKAIDDWPSKTAKKQIMALQEERNQIGKKMRAEKDPARHRELFNQWMELCGQIIEARKESKK